MVAPELGGGGGGVKGWWFCGGGAGRKVRGKLGVNALRFRRFGGGDWVGAGAVKELGVIVAGMEFVGQRVPAFSSPP